MTYCSNCGKAVPPGAKFCPNCAVAVAPQQPGPAEQTPSPQLGSREPRPRGVRFLMPVEIAVGIVLMGFGLLVVASAHPLGLVFVIPGVLSVTVGYGLREARSWALVLGLWAGVVYVILGILLVLSFLGILSIIFGAVTLYYFTRADLKRYLKKVPPQSEPRRTPD